MRSGSALYNGRVVDGINLEWIRAIRPRNSLDRHHRCRVAGFIMGRRTDEGVALHLYFFVEDGSVEVRRSCCDRCDLSMSSLFQRCKRKELRNCVASSQETALREQQRPRAGPAPGDSLRVTIRKKVFDSALNYLNIV